MYMQGQKIFEIGERGKFLYVVMMGALEIGLSDGFHYQVIDLLGKGSIIGTNYFLNNLQWPYTARVVSMSALILKIDHPSL